MDSYKIIHMTAKTHFNVIAKISGNTDWAMTNLDPIAEVLPEVVPTLSCFWTDLENEHVN